MPLTVAGVETEIVSLLSGKLIALDVSTLTNGSNPDLRGPIRKALGWLGLSASNPPLVVNADLATMTGWDIEKYLDAVTLEALYICMGQCAGVDMKVGTNEQRWSQLSAEIKAMISSLEARLLKPYGPNVQGGAVGMPSHHIPHSVPLLRPDYVGPYGVRFS